MNTMMRLALVATVLVSATACAVDPDVDTEMLDSEEEMEVGLDELAAAPEASLVFGNEIESNNSYSLANPIKSDGMKGKIAPLGDFDWYKWTIPTNAKYCFDIINNTGKTVMNISHDTGVYAERVKSKCISGAGGTKIYIVLLAPGAALAESYTLKVTKY